MSTNTTFRRLRRIILPLLILIGTIPLLGDSGSATLLSNYGPLQGLSYATDARLREKLPVQFFGLNATITTDRQDYRPGATAVITGTGFLPGETVRLRVVHVGPTPAEFTPHQGHDPWDVTADASGNVASSWLVDEDSLDQTLLLTADGLASLLHAEHLFTDASGVDFRQCANKDGVLPLGQCNWINSIVQSSNARYFEGMSNMQRILFTDVTATGDNVHRLTLSHEYTKGGVHAYDFMTSYEQAIKAAADRGVPYTDTTAYTPIAGEPGTINLTLTTARACGPNIGPPGNLGATCTAVRNAGIRRNVELPDDPYADTGEGTTQTRIMAYEAEYGNRYLRIYADAPVSAASITLAHDGADTGDSDVKYILSWTSTASTVLIEVAGHLSVTGDGTGETWLEGSSQINGGPYHFNLYRLNTDAQGNGGESLGSQDNQIKGADILMIPPQGAITIVKDAIPDDPQDFSFTATDNTNTPINPFILDDDLEATQPNQRTFTDLEAGQYTITEGAVAGWDLTDLDCQIISNATFLVDETTRTATINLTSPTGSIICTFTNTKEGRIEVEKQTLPDGSTQSFNFDGDIDVNLTDGQSSGVNVDPGTYSVNEVVPAGWDLTSVVCNDGASTTPSTGSVGTATATFNVEPGETVRCVFTNTQRGHIIVDKVTIPSLDPQSFNFATTGTGYSNFSLTDAAQPNSQEVVPGSYTVSESVPTGWDLTNSVCDNGEAPNSIDVLPGETITCVFTNTKRGKVLVDKVTIPAANTQSFDFTSSFGPFALTDQSALFDSGPIAPGTYSVAETGETGWDLTSATCSDGSPVNAINVGAGETVTCTFTNTKRASITIIKDAVPNDAQDFSFTATESTDTTIPDFSLDDDGDPTLSNTRTFNNLKPGNYSVTEDGETGWSLTNLVCGAGGTPASPTANIVLAAGATVTCTFTNTRDATVTITKDAVPNDAQDFAFSTSGDGPAPWSAFSLDDDADGTLLNSRTFTFPAAQHGAKTVTEGAVAGWDLTGLTCSEGSTNLGTRTASFTVDPGDAITCTFTNTKRGTIRVVKATNPAGAGGFIFTGDAAGTIGDGQSIVVGNLVPGTYTSTEAVMTGWDLTGIVCGTGGSGDTATRTATFNLPAGGDITCTFTNQRLPQLRLIKDIVPNTDTGKFDLRDNTAVIGNEVGDGYDSGLYFTTTGSHTVDEMAGETSPTDLTDYVSKVVCDSGKGSSDPGTSHAFSLGYAEIVTCTFTNTRKASVQVIKTFQGGPITGTETFTFTLRTGASGTETGTVVETQTANSTNGGTLNFATKLTPGTSYQICEVVMVGWSSSIDSLPGAFVIQPEPDGDNSTHCVAFTPTPGQNVVLTIDNIPPPGGDARTIGYWKNWSSCTRGNQAHVLDYILWSFSLGHRVEVDLPLDTFPDGPYSPGVLLGNFPVTNCDAAFNILSKRLANGAAKNGRSYASNPAINMAAQLLAAKLNIQASADPSCILPVIALADQYLAAVNYNGTTAPNFPKPTGDAMNILAGLLDDYNNNDLACPVTLPPAP